MPMVDEKEAPMPHHHTPYNRDIDSDNDDTYDLCITGTKQVAKLCHHCYCCFR